MSNPHGLGSRASDGMAKGNRRRNSAHSRHGINCPVVLVNLPTIDVRSSRFMAKIEQSVTAPPLKYRACTSSNLFCPRFDSRYVVMYPLAVWTTNLHPMSVLLDDRSLREILHARGCHRIVGQDVIVSSL